MNDEERHAAGMTVRREVLGDAHVDRATADATEFTADFQDFITRYAWGEVWTREGLDRRTRSCLTLALLTALRAEGELPMHVRAARRNGLTPVEWLNEIGFLLNEHGLVNKYDQIILAGGTLGVAADAFPRVGARV